MKRIWLDGQTGDPLWASVHTGLFGLKESFVPLQRAELREDQLRVPRPAWPGTPARPRNPAGPTRPRRDDPVGGAAQDRHRTGRDRPGAAGQARGHRRATGLGAVSHEEVRIEREPITGANRDAAMRGKDITEAEHEVTLHAEKPVVDKETVPMERVGLATETVTDQETVSGTVRKEQIDVEDSR